MKSAWSFVAEHSKWVFSGIGVFFLGLLWIAYGPRTPAGTSTAEPAGASISAPPSTRISYADVMTAMRTLPPMQRGDVERRYIGLRVQWDGYLNMADVRDGELFVLLSLRKRSDRDGPDGSIFCFVSPDEYKQMGVLPDEAPVRITGDIKQVKLDAGVELTNVRLEFPPAR